MNEMDVLTMLLFFLCKQEIPVSFYEYRVWEPIRYIEVVEGNQVTIQAGQETLWMEKGTKRIDLNNYYALDSFTIQGTFKQIKFYYRENVVATLFPHNQETYQAEDMILENQFYSYYTFREQEERVGYSFWKYHKEKISLLSLSSFVESIVENPKRC